MESIPLRIIIVDDEPLARERLRHLLGKVGGAEVIGEATCGREALALLEREQPDLAILDIQMADLDGLRVLEALDDPPAVVFATAYDQHAVKAFELGAVDYLLKPFSAERLRKALDRVRRLTAPTQEQVQSTVGKDARICAEDGRATVFVPVGEVSALRVEEGVVFLQRGGERLVCAESLNDLEGQLPAEDFFRVSRQAIVNLRAIEAMEPTTEGGLLLRLRGGSKELVSRRRARILKARLGR